MHDTTIRMPASSRTRVGEPILFRKPLFVTAVTFTRIRTTTARYSSLAAHFGQRHTNQSIDELNCSEIFIGNATERFIHAAKCGTMC